MRTEELESRSDEELAALAADRTARRRADEAADCLLRRYRERVYFWCLRYAREREAALDLTQDVMLKVYRSLPGFAGRSRFSTWLYSVVRNECISAARRRRIVAGDSEEILETLVDCGIGPHERLEAHELERRLNDLVKTRLTPLEQDALWMRCVDLLPVDAITEALGIDAASGARGVLQSARRKLRAALSDDLEPRSPA